jgi:hypothetical protein
MTPMATYDEIDNLSGPELRFRQACQFFALFDLHHGETVDPLDTRFLWMCYADAFLTLLVSLKDHVTSAQKAALNNNDLFRMMTVLRNVTVHQAVVSTASPLTMINRNITFNAGRSKSRHEDAILNSNRITEALDHYEQELKNSGKWRLEQSNVEGARRWNNSQGGMTIIDLTGVFRDTLTVVATICGFTMPIP